MVRLTEEMRRVFKENPLRCKDGQGEDALVIAKFYIPDTPYQWLVTEASNEGRRWVLYGMFYLSEWGWGYVTLEELMDAESDGKLAEMIVYPSQSQLSVAESIEQKKSE